MQGALLVLLVVGVAALMVLPGAAVAHSSSDAAGSLGAQSLIAAPLPPRDGFHNTSLAASSGSFLWSQHFPIPSPGPRNLNGLTYDAADGYAVLFGGGSADGTYWGDTWKYVNGAWVQLAPRESPPPLDSVTLAYDAADHYVVLFGGYELLGPDFGQTWTFHGGQWYKLSPANPPSPRDNPMLAYDAADGYVVMFGGNTPSYGLSDTWTFHAGVWTNITATAGTPPSPRTNSAMAYDSKDKRVVLFGGVVASEPGYGAPLGDTWTFSAGKWTNITGSLTTSPSPRYAAAFADAGPAVGDVLFGGGFSYAYATWVFFQDTWLFSGNRWMNLTSHLWISPSARALVSAASYTPSGSILLFGGCGSPVNTCSGPVSDTWTLGPATIPFTDRVIGVGSEPKGILYDPANHLVYVADYGSDSVSVINSATGGVVATIPTGQHAWQLAYDPANRRLYVANDFTNRLTVIDTRTNAVVGALYAGCAYTVGVVYDHLNGFLYIECDADSVIAIANPATGVVFKHIPVSGGTGNNGIAIDPHTGDLYVANFAGDTVTVISGSTNRAVGVLNVGPNPDGTLYDPISGLVYVSLFHSNQVVLLNPNTGRVVSVVVGGDPEGFAYLGPDHLVAVADTGSDSLTVLDASTGEVVESLPGGSTPNDLAYDAGSQLLFVSDENTGSLLEIGPV